MIILSMNGVQSVPSCSYGSFEAWISLDGSSWMNTTLSNLTLQCGQPFYVKTMMKSWEDDVYLALYVFEPGASTRYEESFIVKNGPCELNDGIDLGKTKRNETRILIWELQVKDDPIWVDGYTPLSVTSFFQKKQNNGWLTEEISFSIANIQLLNEKWVETSQQMIIQNDDITSPSKSIIFPALLFAIMILFAQVFIRKKPL